MAQPADEDAARVEWLEVDSQSASELLGRYHRDSNAWSLPMVGEFWDAVCSAHAMRRTGSGKKIAVIDNGFDTSLPALADAKVFQDLHPGDDHSHGTAAALLVRTVAPDASLVLHSVPGREARKISEALRDCVSDGVDIVNLSAGLGLPLQQSWRNQNTPAEPNHIGEPESPVHDPTYDSPSLDPDDWRRALRIPESPLWQAAFDAVRAGITVVAAAGNRPEMVFVPAATPGVISIGFQKVQRSIPAAAGGTEVARADQPTFQQSAALDFTLQQPDGVVGSSFAAPLVSGFAALMSNRSEVPQFLRCARRGSLASWFLAAWLQNPSAGDVEFLRGQVSAALASIPHPHHQEPENQIASCPECAVFAAETVINGGLFFLRVGETGQALSLLRAASRFAPSNPHAAANLAVTHERLALQELDAAIEGGNTAVALRPDHLPYQAALQRFQEASSYLRGLISQ